jgi:hypothetical protein
VAAQSDGQVRASSPASATQFPFPQEQSAPSSSSVSPSQLLSWPSQTSAAGSGPRQVVHPSVPWQRRVPRHSPCSFSREHSVSAPSFDLAQHSSPQEGAQTHAVSVDGNRARDWQTKPPGQGAPRPTQAKRQVPSSYSPVASTPRAQTGTPPQSVGLLQVLQTSADLGMQTEICSSLPKSETPLQPHPSGQVSTHSTVHTKPSGPSMHQPPAQSACSSHPLPKRSFSTVVSGSAVVSGMSGRGSKVSFLSVVSLTAAPSLPASRPESAPTTLLLVEELKEPEHPWMLASTRTAANIPQNARADRIPSLQVPLVPIVPWQVWAWRGDDDDVPNDPVDLQAGVRIYVLHERGSSIPRRWPAIKRHAWLRRAGRLPTKVPTRPRLNRIFDGEPRPTRFAVVVQAHPGTGSTFLRAAVPLLASLGFEGVEKSGLGSRNPLSARCPPPGDDGVISAAAIGHNDHQDHSEEALGEGSDSRARRPVPTPPKTSLISRVAERCPHIPAPHFPASPPRRQSPARRHRTGKSTPTTATRLHPPLRGNAP